MMLVQELSMSDPQRSNLKPEELIPEHLTKLDEN